MSTSVFHTRMSPSTSMAASMAKVVSGECDVARPGAEPGAAERGGPVVVEAADGALRRSGSGVEATVTVTGSVRRTDPCKLMARRTYDKARMATMTSDQATAALERSDQRLPAVLGDGCDSVDGGSLSFAGEIDIGSSGLAVCEDSKNVGVPRRRRSGDPCGFLFGEDMTTTSGGRATGAKASSILFCRPLWGVGPGCSFALLGAFAHFCEIVYLGHVSSHCCVHAPAACDRRVTDIVALMPPVVAVAASPRARRHLGGGRVTRQPRWRTAKRVSGQCAAASLRIAARSLASACGDFLR